jgi:dimethylargininase
MMFSKAIVRRPAANFAEGLTTVDLGSPSFALVLEQHQRYCDALESCGLHLTHLPADADFPDSTFVEDVAILTGHGAILTRPGAASRAGEVRSMQATLIQFYPELAEISAPGTVDGGDICEAGKHFIIGISLRTNHEGARQLGSWLEQHGYTWSTIDVREVSGILHLKSGIAYLGDGLDDNRMLVIDALADEAALRPFELIRVEPSEEYAANCVRVNQHVIMPAGFPLLKSSLHALGYTTIALDMSEFQKMDGGLSCLSLRF